MVVIWSFQSKFQRWPKIKQTDKQEIDSSYYNHPSLQDFSLIDGINMYR